MWFTLTRWRLTAEAALQLAAATEKVDLAPTSKSAEKRSHCCHIRGEGVTALRNHLNLTHFRQTFYFVMDFIFFSSMLIFLNCLDANKQPVTAVAPLRHHISHQRKKKSKTTTFPSKTDRQNDRHCSESTLSWDLLLCLLRFCALNCVSDILNNFLLGFL